MALKKLLARRLLAVNPSRAHLETWIAEAAATTPPGALVLDAGSGKAPYRHLFSQARYESADFLRVEKAYHAPTYVCDLTAIPVEDARFDRIICTQVLEHVPEPLAVLREFHRVLKPRGDVWLSTPLFYGEHEEPFDFYRYTRYGLLHLARSAGFELARLEWLEGYFGTLAYQLSMAARSLTSTNGPTGGHDGLWRIVRPLVRAEFAFLSRWFARMDIEAPVTSVGMCKNYRCVLVKPS